MDKEDNILKTLDIFLAYYATLKDREPLDKMFENNQAMYWELNEKLISDKYILKDNTNNHTYSITVKGRVFHLNGGYVAEKIISSREVNRIVRNDRQVAIGTIFAGGIALVLLLWQVWIWVHPVFADYHWICNP